MSRLYMNKQGCLQEVIEYLEMHNADMGISVRCAGCFSFDDHWFGVYEKYYNRAGNYASLSLHLYQKDDRVMLEAIGAGGGSGFMNISWGSEGNFVAKLKKLMEQNGFETIQYD